MKRQFVFTETQDLFFNKICQFHKSPLEYACLERNCYSKIRQICTKCVRKTHSNHKIADMTLLISYVDQIKCMIIQSTAQFEKGYYSLPLNIFKSENILKLIEENYRSYQNKMESLIVKIIDLSINLKKYEEFDQYNDIINKCISLVGKNELIDFYFKYMPNKWLKQLQSKIKKCYESIKENDVLINFFDHYRFNQATQKKILLNLPSYRGLKLTNLAGAQLVIIQSTKLYILELEDNKQRLLTHEVDSKINQVYQYKQQQNLLITCGQTLPILKKLDQSHYALWNQNIVEIFDILKSHLKPVVTLQLPIIDIEVVQGKIFLVGKDKILHILN